MGAVMIRCPRTGCAIPTGLEMSSGEFSRAPVFFARAWCPVCACHHEWFAPHAWVCDRPLENGNASRYARNDRSFDRAI
jgi:hypothetical protein